MSFVSLSELSPLLWPDEPGPIGACAKEVPCSAREIVRSSKGELCFGRERPILLGPTWRMLLVRGRERQIWRFEVKSDPRVPGAPGIGDTLVVTEHPYGNGWVEATRFKPGLRRAADERQPPSKDSLEEAIASLQALPHDPWESGRMLTAAPGVPEVVLQGETLRAYGRGARWVFGVCGPVESIVDELVGSARAAELVRSTERGRLVICWPSGRAGHPPLSSRLVPELGEEASEIMLLAVRQALAGPTDPDPEAWRGKPVLDLVEFIFRDHLSNRNRIRRRASSPQRPR